MNKEETYQEILPQIKAIVGGETDLIANMANVAAVLHETFRFWWTGFYLVKENKAMRFDIVVSLAANDRKAVFKEAVADVQKEFPDYKLYAAMDTDFAEE